MHESEEYDKYLGKYNGKALANSSSNALSKPKSNKSRCHIVSKGNSKGNLKVEEQTVVASSITSSVVIEAIDAPVAIQELVLITREKSAEDVESSVEQNVEQNICAALPAAPIVPTVFYESPQKLRIQDPGRKSELAYEKHKAIKNRGKNDYGMNESTRART